MLPSIASQFPSLFRVFDRKLRSLLDFSRIQDSKFIDKIIKSSPKVIYCLTDENTQFRGNGKAECEIATDAWVYIPLYGWSGATEERTFSFEPRQMLFCPTYSRIGIVKRWLSIVGYQRSRHEQETSNAKDFKGTRDTRAHKGRVRAQSKKGSQAEQVNASKPEEVTHQTLSDHRSDGYTSKHTHLGSLEDV